MPPLYRFKILSIISWLWFRLGLGWRRGQVWGWGWGWFRRVRLVLGLDHIPRRAEGVSIFLAGAQQAMWE